MSPPTTLVGTPSDYPTTESVGVPPVVTETLAQTGADTMILVVTATVLIVLGLLCLMASGSRRRAVSGGIVSRHDPTFKDEL